MTRRKVVRGVLWLVCVLALAVAGDLWADQKDRTDLTGRQNVSSDEIIKGLMPSASSRQMPQAKERMRGITPSLTGVATAVVSAAPTVALSVLFATNSDEISPSAAQNLNSLGQALRSPELESYRIRIEGHTDAVGSDAYNKTLSERRAKSVKRYLVNNSDIDANRLVTVGRGEGSPIRDNDTISGREKNRRVEFVNIGR